MATRTRSYRKAIKYHLIVRLRLRAFTIRALRRYYLRLLVQYASASDVVIHAYYLTPNHVHLIVSQSFDGEDPMRRRGISSFMRNSNATFARRINRQRLLNHPDPPYGRPPRLGHVLIETYTAIPLANDWKVLHALIYVHAQYERHGLTTPRDAEATSSWAVYMRDQKDGVVNRRIEFGGVPLGPLLRRGAELGAQIQQTDQAWPWHRACDDVIDEFGLTLGDALGDIPWHCNRLAAAWKRVPVPIDLDLGAL